MSESLRPTALVRDVPGLPYPIRAGADIDASLRAFLADAKGSIVVLCDRNVIDHARRYARAAGPDVRVLPFALGEKRKRLQTVEKVLGALAEAGCDRASTVIGVGGGVAGDLFGFAAACYMRGVRFVNVATTVTAMVDAAIGGKTGVDLAAGKNLAGVFADPAAVFAPLDALRTLPRRHVREGLGEVVKHAVLAGEEAFATLERLADAPIETWPWETIVPDSIAQKVEVVREDRTEAGRRELLNLGHTFAHGYERASGYRIAHGAAVAIGLRAAGLLGVRLGMFDPATHARVLRLIRALGLPSHARRVRAEHVFAAMAADKKARGGALRFVVPRALGDVEFGVLAQPELVRAVIDESLHAPARDEFER